MSFGEFYNATAGLGDAYSKGLTEYDQKTALSKLGIQLQGNDYSGAARTAFGAGDATMGLSILKLGQAQEQAKAGNAAFGLLGGLYGGAPSAAAAPTSAPASPAADRSVPFLAGNPDIARAALAIQGNESGGKYDIVGPTHPKYGRALGAYQVMESNLPSWSKETLGREVSPDEFLKNPQIQDAIFQKKFGQSVAKYGNPQDAASVWFTGRPLAQGANAKDVLGTTGQSYVDKFTAGLNRIGGGAPAPSRAPIQTASADPSFMPQTPTAPGPLTRSLAPTPPAPQMTAPMPGMPAGAPVMQMPGAQAAAAPQVGEDDAPEAAPVSPQARAEVSAQAPQHLAQAGLPPAAAQAVGISAPGSQQRISILMRMAGMPGLNEGQASVVKTLLSNELEQTKLPDSAKQYLFAKSAAGGGFDGTYADFQNKKGDEGAKIQAQLAAREKYLTDRGMDPKDPGNQAWIMGGKTSTGHVLKPGDILSGPGGQELARNASAASSMPEETADFLAERVISGDNRALVGLGRGAQGAENLAKIQGLVAKKAAERGLDGTDILYNASKAAGIGAQERSLGTSAGRMAAASVEAEGAIRLGLEASAKVPRGTFVPLNRAMQMVQSNTGSPELKQFVAANNTIVNTFARAISPSGTPTVADKEHAREMLSTADGPEAYAAVLQQMQREIDMAHKAPQQASSGLERERQAAKPGVTLRPNPFTPAPTSAPAPAAPPTAPTAPVPAARVPTATNPKTGEKIELRNGQWVPVQAPAASDRGIL